MLEVKTMAPDFRLPDQNGILQSLAEHRGKYILLYFYPKDDTTGCTKEACVIRDAYQDFEKYGVTVFGVSADSVESHKKFAEKYHLPFTLLSDEKRKVIILYGANKGFASTKRISYLIDSQGMIIKTYPKVDPTEHGGEILADVYALKSLDEK